MNIFYLDRDPKIAAKFHCNKHVVKMIVEGCQLLSTAHRMLDGISTPGTKQLLLPGESLSENRKTILNQKVYKASHKNHRSAVWVRSCSGAYWWQYNLAYELCKEYTYRYRKIHKSQTLLDGHLAWAPANIPNDVPFTPPPLAMPEKYFDSDHVSAYRKFYIGEKHEFARWKKREIPFWYSDSIELEQETVTL